MLRLPRHSCMPGCRGRWWADSFCFREYEPSQIGCIAPWPHGADAQPQLRPLGEITLPLA
jgi:hypothetical protein